MRSAENRCARSCVRGMAAAVRQSMDGEDPALTRREEGPQTMPKRREMAGPQHCPTRRHMHVHVMMLCMCDDMEERRTERRGQARYVS